MGRRRVPAHDERYDRADEYLEVLYKLWEGSWDDDAVRRDRAARVFADPGADPHGRSPGQVLRRRGLSPVASRRRSARRCCSRPAARAAASASPARHAECVFISAPRQGHGAATSVRAIAPRPRRPGATRRREGVHRHRRRRRADPRRGARQARRLHRATPAAEAGLAHFSAGTGIDFARYGLDEPIDYAPGNAIQSATAAAAKRGLDEARPAVGNVRARRPLRRSLTGERPQVADELQSWVDGRRGRRLQPQPHRGAGVLRGLRRPRGAGAAGSRRLQDRLSPTARCATSCSARATACPSAMRAQRSGPRPGCLRRREGMFPGPRRPKKTCTGSRGITGPNAFDFSERSRKYMQARPRQGRGFFG